MNFVTAMLFTQQVSHLEYLLFWIKSHPGVSYKSVVYKKQCCFKVL